MEEKKQNLIQELSFSFALSIIEYADKLEKEKKFVLANQLLKSGTAVGASVREAQGAESKPDFIHKLKIAYKEAEETEYWLLLCSKAKNYPAIENRLKDIETIKRILGKIISTSRKG